MWCKAKIIRIFMDKQENYRKFFRESADNLIKEQKVTVEIYSKGGIDAESGLYDFKVYPVQVVSGISRTRRENSSSKRRQPHSSKPAVFTEALEKAIAENQPMGCYTVTYDVNGELQKYHYQPTREYNF